MANKSYWRRAVVVSYCIHCLLFVGAGWLGGSIFSKAAEPETIEMELISSVALPEQAAQVPVTMPQAASSSTVNPIVSDPARPITPHTKPVASAPASEVIADRFSPAAESAAPSGAAVPAATTGATTGGSAGVESTAPAASAAPKRISAPRVLNKVEPDYPQDARQEGVGGTVGVKVEVLENGRPGEVQLARSSGRRSLDEAALQAVRQWQFVPAQEAGSGEAVRCYTTFSVVFELS